MPQSLSAGAINMCTPVLVVLLSLPLQVEPAEYFLKYRTAHSWMLDRSNNPDVISVAANGFAMPAWAILSKQGKILPTQASQWIKECFRETLKYNTNNHGWLYHFMDLKGNPVYNLEVSSIDSALFYLGAREAAKLMDDTNFATEVETSIKAVDVKFMLTNAGLHPEKRYFSQGFIWLNGKPVFLECDWQKYSEGMLLYRLFNVAYTYPPIEYDLPLFVYYYPLCYYDEQEILQRLGQALDYQAAHYATIGSTACDGPSGYGVMEAGIVSPLALACCEFFFPDKVRGTLAKLPGRTIPAYDTRNKQVIVSRIAIDDGAYLLLKHKRGASGLARR